MSDAPVRSPLFSLASMEVDRERIDVAVLESVRSADPYAGSRNRHLYSMRKQGPTPTDLPRRAGMAKKRPRGVI